MIQWVFLDIGNVLFNDDNQTYYIHRRFSQVIAEHSPGFSFQQFLADREFEISRGHRAPTQAVMLRHISQRQLDELYHQVTQELRPLYDAMHFPMPYAQSLLEELADSYRLAIVANQVVECRASLERWNLLEYFEFVAISEEIDLHKPDPSIFRWALERADTRPDEAVMVGDRHDNDIVPASSLGMHSIWVRWPSLNHKGWEPKEPEARAFVESHEREPFYGRVTRPEVSPSAVVANLREVAPAIRSLSPRQ